MSWKNVPTLVCDGCGQVIDMDFYIRLDPSGQRVVQKDHSHSPERDFCCEACKEWWRAEYPPDGAWGPAWDEREWWRHQMQTTDHVPVRTTHDDLPLVDTHAHFDDPQPLP